MKSKEVRNLSDQDLADALEDQKENLFMLRLQDGFGRLEDPTAIRQARRTIARMKTIMREREIQKEKGNG
ncbi:MAG: 50S ribosomal protein L29 [Anaerolineae bacterium]|nr:50S ribosomal protein L29 [Anaerolineae bacterium]MCK6577540.1 50S ribosomal protein L29 [Anaerolineae bacterium]NUQ03612.1 50S ribosomal protein L29 [Anaerolineae bacterium]